MTYSPSKYCVDIQSIYVVLIKTLIEVKHTSVAMTIGHEKQTVKHRNEDEFVLTYKTNKHAGSRKKVNAFA